jgi:arsenite methyltransferase
LDLAAPRPEDNADSGSNGHGTLMSIGAPKRETPGPILRALLIVTLVSAPALGQERPRNIWAEQYRGRRPADLAAQFENPSRPVYRHRADIVRLLELRPGMTVAEIGAGSGFLSRMIAESVMPTGKAVATELDEAMVRYMNERARAEGRTNFTAIRGVPTSTGLEPKSMDAILIVNTFSFFDQPEAMMRSVSEALKAGGRVLIVDFPRAGSPPNAEGVDPTTVIGTAARVGLTKVGESSVVPGHFAITFQKLE